MKAPVRVAVTGAAGQIGYSLLFRIASGEMLGADQPVILQLLEITPALDALRGVVMELEDCAFPLVQGIIPTDDPNVAFGRELRAPRRLPSPVQGHGAEGLDRSQCGDLLRTGQGSKRWRGPGRQGAGRGNPANTNCLIAQRNAPDPDPRQFTAMTRLDHNRAAAQLAAKTGAHVTEVEGLAFGVTTPPPNIPIFIAPR